MSARNDSDLDTFVVFGGATLEDGTDTANESETTAINLCAGSAFAPLTQPITEINGEAVQDGSTVTTANGSTGGSGRDILIDHAGQDTLAGGIGQDQIKAGGDGDTIVFAQGDGFDRINGFGGTDVIDLTAFNLDVFADLNPFLDQTTSGEALIRFGGGDLIKLVGFQLANLQDSDVLL